MSTLVEHRSQKRALRRFGVGLAAGIISGAFLSEAIAILTELGLAGPLSSVLIPLGPVLVQAVSCVSLILCFTVGGIVGIWAYLSATGIEVTEEAYSVLASFKYPRSIISAAEKMIGDGGHALQSIGEVLEKIRVGLDMPNAMDCGNVQRCLNLLAQIRHEAASEGAVDRMVSESVIKLIQWFDRLHKIRAEMLASVLHQLQQSESLQQREMAVSSSGSTIVLKPKGHGRRKVVEIAFEAAIVPEIPEQCATTIFTVYPRMTPSSASGLLELVKEEVRSVFASSGWLEQNFELAEPHSHLLAKTVKNAAASEIRKQFETVADGLRDIIAERQP